MSFTIGLGFLDSQVKRLPVSLKDFSRYVLWIERPRPQFHSFRFILSCIIEKEGLMTNSIKNFINGESLWS